MSRVIILFLLISLNCDFSDQFPHGSPPSRCTNMEPMHSGAITQESPSPYKLVVSEKVIGNGQQLKVEIRSDEPGRTFAGFLLQARTVTEPFVVDGLFVGGEEPFNYLNCSVPRSAVTNSNRERRESISFDWTAPREYTGKIRFQ